MPGAFGWDRAHEIDERIPKRYYSPRTTFDPGRADASRRHATLLRAVLEANQLVRLLPPYECEMQLSFVSETNASVWLKTWNFAVAEALPGPHSPPLVRTVSFTSHIRYVLVDR